MVKFLTSSKKWDSWTLELRLKECLEKRRFRRNDEVQILPGGRIISTVRKDFRIPTFNDRGAGTDRNAKNLEKKEGEKK
jgi:hypothetical protein